jgi:hypothetical protein
MEAGSNITAKYKKNSFAFFVYALTILSKEVI